jgi:serine/threonine protein kinase
MENGSLEDALRGGPTPAAEAVPFFRDVVVGLVHAHGKGILHCDIKPANILIDQDHKPRLADFGQARLRHEQSPSLGTLFYMAPEQADLQALPDVRWDVYALGALLYKMLTGEPPNSGEPGAASLLEPGPLEERLVRYRRLIREAPPPAAHRQAPAWTPRWPP